MHFTTLSSVPVLWLRLLIRSSVRKGLLQVGVLLAGQMSPGCSLIYHSDRSNLYPETGWKQTSLLHLINVHLVVILHVRISQFPQRSPVRCIFLLWFFILWRFHYLRLHSFDDIMIEWTVRKNVEEIGDVLVGLLSQYLPGETEIITENIS